MDVKISEFELKVLRRIARRRIISGNKMVAISAAARRLERKGLALKGLEWYVTDEGQAILKRDDSGDTGTGGG